jgi:hypothetical protein
VLYPLSYGGGKPDQTSKARGCAIDPIVPEVLHEGVRPLCRSAGAAFDIGGAE